MNVNPAYATTQHAERDWDGEHEEEGRIDAIDVDEMSREKEKKPRREEGRGGPRRLRVGGASSRLRRKKTGRAHDLAVCDRDFG